jgi:hypothetical protein
MNLEQLFDSLSAGDLDSYIVAGQEEHLLLDFKTITKSDLSHSDDKKNLAKAISGFANSSGGIVIWGIDARKNQNGIDCAVGKEEIKSLSMFLSRLNEFTGLAVSPIADGVRHRSILTGVDEGFAISLIPESDSPYMAKFHEDRYYKRSGDSFYRWNISTLRTCLVDDESRVYMSVSNLLPVGCLPPGESILSQSKH